MHGPAGGAKQSRQQLDQGGFAGAVPPEDGDALTRSDAEIDAVEHAAWSVLCVEVLDEIGCDDCPLATGVQPVHPE